MVSAVDRQTTFREVRLSTTDAKVKVRVNQCSTCNALVPPSDTIQHRRFHDDVRAIARQAGLTR
jgi:hypothetical protein